MKSAIFWHTEFLMLGLLFNVKKFYFFLQLENIFQLGCLQNKNKCAKKYFLLSRCIGSPSVQPEVTLDKLTQPKMEIRLTSLKIEQNFNLL